MRKSMYKIKKLTMENFGVFKKKQEIEFSTDEQKPLTVIIGQNGAGKTTLVNAINWCFYENKPRGIKSDGYPIINLSYLKEQGKDKTVRTSVNVILQVGDEQYSISRTLTVMIHDLEFEKMDGGHAMKMTILNGYNIPSGCEILSDETTFVISRKGPNDTDFHQISTEPNVKMNEILPRDLPVFFLDGEFLESLRYNNQYQDRLKQFSNQSVEQRANLADKMNEFKDKGVNRRSQEIQKSKFVFDETGNLRLIDETGQDIIGILAMTESFFVNLIWVLAIRHFVAPNSFLVIDCIGRLSLDKMETLMSLLFCLGDSSQIIWLELDSTWKMGGFYDVESQYHTLRELVLKKQVLKKECHITYSNEGGSLIECENV
jgi:energy-coupling factor transporter ATP-binding protein EcfA2